MKILDKHLHGEPVKRPLTRSQRKIPKRGYTVAGTIRKRGLYLHTPGGAEQRQLALIPRHDPRRIAQASRLREIRQMVNEMRRIGGGYWPPVRTDTHKPRKAS